MSTLQKAISIAIEAHAGQFDKAGAPYISHPLRVMQRCVTESEQIAAVLHDVVEDTNVTMCDLQRHGFSDEIIAALQCLTKKHGEQYEEFISRVMTNHLARRVKMADLIDNLDCSRLRTVDESDLARIKRYVAALNRLRDE
ncbi:HD domain-containing protein [Pseudoduganella albidiflava]|uniref:Bifunctional (P)ppGpp synthetase/guanosine-3',5'-bis(Diphosphate) 3'-pyrophosphohydrolase n=1 Tax=Pseudoduganella albidiflava TaxID=321983 RepID=A0A411X148_9BURK|nr:bifunctional (p)ppGpp synthetase/guanosine-3',5'-bis(diphosphate) 3'-pyrophosphohydrolase [Pseudoduganella albidiflava]QBI02690.1 bifunctional (p)ppGpp synthetase/guanosine-3',5'-bis(diphosphate) 3'-pyrophosphohydrolase [Pseudoduganella albidiflava]GGY68647.1 hypothetical protein GCM10007387_58460 [Pseudoduganella albidiflava]